MYVDVNLDVNVDMNLDVNVDFQWTTGALIRYTELDLQFMYSKGNLY